jgi:hypothetical protein
LKIVYHCYGGAHASPTAAAIHLGIIRDDRLPEWSDFKRIPYFDRITSNEHGKLIFIDRDESGHEIYILARRNAPKIVINLIREFSKLTGADPNEYYFVNCVQLYNPLMVTGGFSSRALGWVKFGRPLVTLGTIVSFPILVSKVRKTIQNTMGK